LSKAKCVRTKDQIAHGDILTETTTRWNSSHTNPPGGLANYYRNNVIGGPGAFVMVTENFTATFSSNVFFDEVVVGLVGKLHFGHVAGEELALGTPLFRHDSRPHCVHRRCNRRLMQYGKEPSLIASLYR
jgi:hypothetical protein